MNEVSYGEMIDGGRAVQGATTVLEARPCGVIGTQRSRSKNKRHFSGALAARPRAAWTRTVTEVDAVPFTLPSVNGFPARLE